MTSNPEPTPSVEGTPTITLCIWCGSQGCLLCRQPIAKPRSLDISPRAFFLTCHRLLEDIEADIDPDSDSWNLLHKVQEQLETIALKAAEAADCLCSCCTH